MKKRFLASVLALTLAASVFAACGNTNEVAEAPVEETVEEAAEEAAAAN